MKKWLLILGGLFYVITLTAQEEKSKLKFQFYGFFRADLCYDNRASVTSNEGLFFLYPLDGRMDVNGKDLNDSPSIGFYSFNTRPGVTVSGLQLFGAEVSALAEADFAGFGGANGVSSILRLRRAYMNFRWEKSDLLVGQDWHPFFGPVTPGQVSLSTGAPFNAFNRSPQIRFNYTQGGMTFSAMTLFQSQFTSAGPSGKSSNYQRKALLPELAALVNYRSEHIMAGAGLRFLSLQPRSESTWNYNVYKVDEKIESLAYTAYLKYTLNLFSVSAKTTYGENLSDLTMLGGYAYKEADPTSGEREYTGIKNSASWLNFSYGKKHKGNLLIGYSKNLGTRDELSENYILYGEGLQLDCLTRVVGTYSYNVPHFQLALEYEYSNANYGSNFNLKKGKYTSSHFVDNQRILAVATYLF